MFVPPVDAFADCLSVRVLPAFDRIDEEGSRIQTEEYQRLCRITGPDDEPDLASLAEQAHDRAISYYVTMHEVAQGVVNLFAVGLWHLFEQQLAGFVRRAVLPYPSDGPADNPNFCKAASLMAERGVEITRLPSYTKVNQLRLLSNCAKHGDGSSCAELRALRPDLFDPRHRGSLPSWPTPVIAPLGGEDLYLTGDDFRSYAEAVKAFWSELSKELCP